MPLSGQNAVRFAAVPPPLPGARDASGVIPARHVRKWSVTHACDAAECILPLAEAQAEIGMRPALLTPAGWFNPSDSALPNGRVSLVHAWREVRQWRSLFDEHGINAPGEILHAHTFSAGMAGVRAGAPVVYDFSAPVGSGAAAGPWLTRSLRVAEGFVLARAAAVVVHSQRMWDAAVAQGVRPEDLFLIPEPVAVPHFEKDESAWLEQVTGRRGAVAFFAAPDSQLEILLRAFAIVAEECEDARLLLEYDNAECVARHASSLDIADRVHVLSASDRPHALASAAVVIVGASVESPNRLALEAQAHGRALLAADLPENREVTPHGRGCLWFAHGSARDLAFRASFLARNADFRAALGANGRAHMETTRSGMHVARQYDEVYRHALHRQRGGPDLLHHVPALALCC